MNGFGIVGIIITILGAVLMALCFQTSAWEAARSAGGDADENAGGMGGLIHKIHNGLPVEDPRKIMSYTGAVLMLAGIVIVLVSLGSDADEYIR